MMNNRHLFLFVSLSLLMPTACAEQVYRWVDESGNVHFSNKPLGKDAKSITIKQQPRLGSSKPGAENSAPPQYSQEKLLNAYSERRELKKKQQQAKNEQQNIKIQAQQKKCDKAMQYLAHDGYRIYDTTETGERIYRSDEQIASDRVTLQSYIDKHCR